MYKSCSQAVRDIFAKDFSSSTTATPLAPNDKISSTLSWLVENATASMPLDTANVTAK